nr:DUF3604 domain-containing protein [Candidatus Sigynarchaeota archaeon]
MIWMRCAVFLFGAYTTTWYFFSFIGVAVGLSYFLAFRDRQWKRHGLVLAWISGIGTFILINIAIAHAAGLPTLSTTYLAMSIGPGAVATYITGFLLHQRRLKKSTVIPAAEARYERAWKALPRYGRTLLLCGICLGPVLLWSSVNIDFGVMFDNTPCLIWVHTPTTARPGVSFNVTIEAWDVYERLSAIYAGTVAFTIRSYNLTTFSPLSSTSAALPAPYTFNGQALPSDWAYEIRDGRDNGLHVFDVTIDTPGIHYLLVNDTATMNTYWSNPIIVNDTADADSLVLWGDIHAHSQLSDGSGTPEHFYYYARHVACLDYAALTDHAETMQFTPGGLDTLERVTNDAYAPGQFVALQGMEWTQANAGHKTCVFSAAQIPKNPPLSFIALPKPADLWNALDAFTAATGCRALAIPHHTTKVEYIEDWTYTNPKYEKFAEATSVHGECLFEQRDPLDVLPCGDRPATYTNGSAIMDGLKMGYRLGLAANSDEHDGHPGHSLGHTAAYIGHQEPLTLWVNRIDLPCPGGITAVRASNLTRQSIFSGLERGLIYASSDHGRPFLDFSINGTRVSYNATFLVVNSMDTRAITVMIAQDGAPAPGMRPRAAAVTPGWLPDWNATIQIFKNGVLLTSIPINGPVVTATFSDAAAVSGASYDAVSCTELDGQYYINNFSDNPVNPAALNTDGEDFYLVRIVGHNGRIAYAGPIWVQAAS